MGTQFAAKPGEYLDVKLYSIVNNKGKISEYLADRFIGPIDKNLVHLRKCDNEECFNLIAPEEPDAFFLHHEQHDVMVCSTKCQDEWQLKDDFFRMNPDLKGDSNEEKDILQSGRAFHIPTELL